MIHQIQEVSGRALRLDEEMLGMFETRGCTSRGGALQDFPVKTHTDLSPEHRISCSAIQREAYDQPDEIVVCLVR